MERRLVFLLIWMLAVSVAVGATQMSVGKPISRYDPATVETLKGTVEEVKLMAFGRSRIGGGVHLQVNTDKETVEVHLGPRFYLEETGFEVEAGETVQVTGSRVKIGDRSALIARELLIGDYRLQLREEDGTPVWAGRRGRARQPGMGMRGDYPCRHCCHHANCGCGQGRMCGRRAGP